MLIPMASGTDWSPGFFQQLSVGDPEVVDAVNDLLVSVRQARTAKPPRDLTFNPAIFPCYTFLDDDQDAASR